MLGKFLKIFGGDNLGGEKPPPATAPAADKTPDVLANELVAEGNHAEQAGNLQVACERYRKAVETAPGNANAHLNLGIGLEAAGDIELACKSYETVLRIDPANSYANYNLGRHFFSRNDLVRAEPLLKLAVQSNPGFPEARVVLSMLLERGGDLAAAAAELEAALRDRPDYFGALGNYADLLLKLGRRDDARSALRKAATLQPGDFGANYKLANLFVQAGQHADAQRYFEQALRIKPDSIDTLAAMVNLHTTGGRLDAEVVFRKMIAIDPAFASAYQMLGATLVAQCRVQDALAILAEGRKRCPDAFELESAELFALNCVEEVSADELFQRHASYGKRLEQHKPARFAFRENSRDPGRRLRVGYVSSDLKRHVVPQFLLPLLEERDRSAIEIHCYSTGDTSDDMTARVRTQSDVWRDAGRMNSEQLADLIHNDHIDILIDLTGHSSVSNLEVFAQAPAPIQASWLGYLNTTGMTRMQYRLTDDYCDPPDLTDRYHTEKLVRLPNSQWCYRPYVEVDLEQEAPVRKNGTVTFGSFNHGMKITGGVRRLWSEILRKLPESRLLVAGMTDEQARENFHRDLEQSGVARGRITIFPYMAPEEYFRLFGKVDIALDTMPFSGGTTTCDALWMGVPVITLPGVKSWSRSASSVLVNLGLDDWVARSEQDYVRRAVAFSADASTIAELRRSLRSRMLGSPLMDRKQFARDVEAAYRRMWQSWCEQPGV